MTEPIETARLLLDRAEVGDAPLLVALDADPEVMRYLTGGRPTTLSDARARLTAPGASLWLARLRDGGDAAGWFSLRADGDGGYELGYRLHRRHWGRGLATEGAAAMIERAFERLDAVRVWGQTMTVNVASRGVMERCGLRHTETFFADWGKAIEGADHGDVRYEVSRSDRAGR